MSGLLGLHVDNHAFGSEQASRGSKSSFDRLPRQEIASRNCWRGRFGPEYRKMDRHIWESCRVGPGLGRIFHIFSEWSEMVLEGLRTISWGSGGRFWDQLFVFGPWKVSLIFQVIHLFRSTHASTRSPAQGPSNSSNLLPAKAVISPHSHPLPPHKGPSELTP